MVRGFRSAAQRLAQILTAQRYVALRDRFASVKATFIDVFRTPDTNNSGTISRLNGLEHRLTEEVAERIRHDHAPAPQITHPSQGTYVFPISDDIVAEACRRVAVTDAGRQDAGGRTAHALVTRTDGSRAWLKVSGLSGSNQDPCRAAEIESERLTGLAKPEVITSAEWQRDGVHWRSVLMAVASSPAAAKHPWHSPSIADLPADWFTELRDALQAVQRVSTPHYIYTPDDIRDLIKAYLPAGLPTEADVWRTQHCDLHWSNLTTPHLMLLDWEFWGLAPLGYGAGRLLVFSLLAPDVARELETLFADEFSTASGQVGVLAAIAVVRKQIESGGVPKDLEAPIASLIDRIQNGNFCAGMMLPTTNLSASLLGTVQALPLAYQPIFGHPELSKTSLRPCEDRLKPIIRLCDNLRRSHARPLRILDLGCAQGYISFRLAQNDNIVTGIDNIPQNIAVCNALSREHPELDVRFETTTVAETIERLAPGDYDVVLGLSILHHLCHDHGKDKVASWLEEIAGKIIAGVFELALPSEIANWAKALPGDVRDLLVGFGNVHEVAMFEQPSAVLRPLYFCSRDPLALAMRSR